MTWTTMRLKHVARVGYGLGQPPTLSETGVPILRATNITRGKFTSDGLIFAAKEDLPLNRAPLLHEGEILVVRSGAYTGDSALVTSAWAGSAPGYDLRVSPTRAHPAYVAYCLLSTATLDQVELAKARAAQPHLNAEDLGDATINLPSLNEQRRIADFLDAETAKVDRLEKTQLSVVQLMRERRSRVLDEVLIQSRFNQDRPGSWCPLGYLTEYGRPIMYGIVLPGPNVEDGIPIVKGGDVAAGRLSLAQLNKTTREIEADFMRSRLRSGDLVIAIRGSVGEVAMVPEEIAGANLTQDAARIAPGPGVHGRWLELILQTPTLEAQISSRITGATIKGINIWDLRRVQVPLIRFDEQLTTLKQADATLEVMSELASAAKRQIALLAERRQALITAAVTGQIDVTAAHGVASAGGAGV